MSDKQLAKHRFAFNFALGFFSAYRLLLIAYR